MPDTFDAAAMSPVPPPDPDAVPPEPFRGIYGMPVFLTVPTTDLVASTGFWTRALGFIELFRVPGQLTHLRRWAFQDVLLVPAARVPDEAPAIRVGVACVPSQIDRIAAACGAWDAATVGAAHETAWNTREVEVVTPERVRLVFTAARPFDPSVGEADWIRPMRTRAPAAQPGSAAQAGPRRSDREHNEGRG